MKTRILIIILCIYTGMAVAQARPDIWPGTWRMEYKPWPHIPAVIMELRIGEGRQKTLYPAQLKLNYATFSATYEL
ncbi:MAG TPA: hypothetical protein VM802_24555, partial [Chitinophaga sp.]|uniref:hypothetical protein n=1 Tax=Chitinophaga sp. TaxID=1869181 RepID=UPI002BAD1F9C